MTLALWLAKDSGSKPPEVLFLEGVLKTLVCFGVHCGFSVFFKNTVKTS